MAPRRRLERHRGCYADLLGIDQAPVAKAVLKKFKKQYDAARAKRAEERRRSCKDCQKVRAAMEK
jgi:hypothetical protein